MSRGDIPGLGAIVGAVGIEAETSCLAIERLVWVDDAGTVINPLSPTASSAGGWARPRRP